MCTIEQIKILTKKFKKITTEKRLINTDLHLEQNFEKLNKKSEQNYLHQFIEIIKYLSKQ